MIFLAVVGGVIVIALGLAASYDHRAKRRGWRVGASTEEAFQHRMDVKSMTNPDDAGRKRSYDLATARSEVKHHCGARTRRGPQSFGIMNR